MRTDLDELLFKKVGGEIGKLADGYEVKIREELASRLAPELDRNADLSASLAALQESAGDRSRDGCLLRRCAREGARRAGEAAEEHAPAAEAHVLSAVTRGSRKKALPA